MRNGAHIRAALILLCAAALTGSPARAQGTSSPTLVASLGAAMAERKLESVAARDPSNPDYFIAAMYFPKVQLLVVAGRYPSPAYLDDLIEQHKYTDVYLALQQSAVPSTKIFFHDMGADGLPVDENSGVDILYEQVTNQTIFNGEWKSQDLSEREYKDKLRKAEESYRALLRCLVAALTRSDDAGGAAGESGTP